MVKCARYLAQMAHPAQEEHRPTEKDDHFEPSADYLASGPPPSVRLPAVRRAGRSQFRGTIVPYAIEGRGLHDHTQASVIVADRPCIRCSPAHLPGLAKPEKPRCCRHLGVARASGYLRSGGSRSSPRPAGPRGRAKRASQTDNFLNREPFLRFQHFATRVPREDDGSHGPRGSEAGHEPLKPSAQTPSQ